MAGTNNPYGTTAYVDDVFGDQWDPFADDQGLQPDDPFNGPIPGVPPVPEPEAPALPEDQAIDPFAGEERGQQLPDPSFDLNGGSSPFDIGFDPTLDAPEGITPVAPTETEPQLLDANGMPVTPDMPQGLGEIEGPALGDVGAGELNDEEVAAVPDASDVAASDLSPEALRQRIANKQYEAAQERDEAMRIAQGTRDRQERFLAESEVEADRRMVELQGQRREIARTPIDPKRYFEDRGTFQTILDVIGGALGGYVGRKNGTNAYMDIIKSRIQQDIQSQLESKRSSLDDIGNEMGNVAELRKRGVRAKQAAYLTYDRALAEANDELARRRASFAPGGTSEEGAAALEEAINAERRQQAVTYEAEVRKEAREETKLKLQTVDREIALQRLDLDRQTRLAKLSRGSGVGRGGAGARSSKRLASGLDDLAKELGVTSKERPLLVLVNPHAKGSARGGLAINKERAAEATTALTTGREIADLTGQLVSSIEKHGWEPTNDRWMSDAGVEMVSVYNRLRIFANRDAKLGALSGDDLGIIDGMLGGQPSKLRVGDSIAALKRYRSNVISSTNRVLDSAGLSAKFNPPIPKAIGLKTVHTADAFLKVKAARTKQERDVASREFFDMVNGRDGSISQKLRAEASKFYGALPASEREFRSFKDGKVSNEIDPIQELGWDEHRREPKEPHIYDDPKNFPDATEFDDPRAPAIPDDMGRF